MTFKEKVYGVCSDLMNDKISLLQQKLRDLKESASNETKSTAGDKHETALAMLQIEQKNTGIQLENSLSQKAVLDKIHPTLSPMHVTQGALVKTNQGYLFLSIALGKIKVDGTLVIALSPQSPLGSKLMGLNIGEQTMLNGVTYIVHGLE